LALVENFEVKEADFEKTLSIFRSMTRKPLKIKVSPIYLRRRQGMSVDTNYIIEIPQVVFGKVNYETYYAYVIFEHEIAHVVFKTDIDEMIRWAESKEYQNIAKAIFNIVEDERVDVLWNELYTTPLRIVWKYFRGVIQPQTPLDILLDVRCNNKVLDTSDYIKVWNRLQEMLKGVHNNVYMESTTRVSEVIYDYIISLMDKEEREKEKEKEQKAAQQPKPKDSPSQPKPKSVEQKQEKMDTSDKKSIDDELAFMAIDNMQHQLGSKFPNLKLGIKSKGLTVEEEIERTKKMIEGLKSRMAHTNTRETPESLMSEFGGIVGEDFVRSERPLEIDKCAISLNIKAIETEWIDDEGEYLDVEEVIYKRLTNDSLVSTMVDEVEGLGMHVLFLLDYSGSMNNKAERGDNAKTKVEILASIVWSIWNELTLIPGCKVEAIIYSGLARVYKSQRGGLSSVRLDTPNELLYYRPQGGTKSATALQYAYRVITTRSERGVIIHVTDGDTFDKVGTANVLRQIQDEGVPVFNIFITTKQIEYVEHADRGSYITVNIHDLSNCIKKSIVPLLENYLKEIT
jgi:hypothetical protein